MGSPIRPHVKVGPTATHPARVADCYTFQFSSRFRSRRLWEVRLPSSYTMVSSVNYWAGNFTKKLVWFHSCYPNVFIFNSMSLFKTQGIIIAVLFICDYYCLGNFS
jgi:hypothetical protein